MDYDEQKNPLDQSYLRLPREGGKLDGAYGGDDISIDDEAEDLLISDGDIAIEEEKRDQQADFARATDFSSGDKVSFKGDDCIVISGPDDEGLYELQHLELQMEFLTGPHDLTLQIQQDVLIDELNHIAIDNPNYAAMGEMLQISLNEEERRVTKDSIDIEIDQ